MSRLKFGLIVGFLIAGLALAGEPHSASGSFKATSRCRAPTNIKGNNNPGNIRLEENKNYQVFQQYCCPLTHYRVVVDDAPSGTESRWIPVECGVFTSETDEPDPMPDPTTGCPGGDCPADALGDDTCVLALTWEAAFCETMRFEADTPGNKENREVCKKLNKGPKVDTFHLHGLWPSKHPGRGGCPGPKTMPAITPAIKSELDKHQPAQWLHQHEWEDHGRCYGDGDANTYWEHAIRLVKEANASPLGALFAKNLNKHVSLGDIKHALEDFDKGASKRLQTVQCRNDQTNDDREPLITEIRLRVRCPLGAHTTLKDALRAADADFTMRTACEGGVVDPVGDQ